MKRAAETTIELEAQPQSGIDVKALILRYAPLAILTTLLGCLAGVAMLVLDTPVYRTSVIVEVKALNDSELRGKGDLLAPSFDITSVNVSTQIKLLQAGPTVRKVFSELSLLPPPKIVSGGLFADLRRRFRKDATDPIKTQQQALMRAAQTFDARPINGTRLIELMCESTHPEIAAEFVNEVARDFVTDSDRQRNEGMALGSKILRTQLAETQAVLEENESALRKFVASSRSQLGVTEVTIDDARLRQLQGDLAGAQADRLTKQAKYEAALRAKPESASEIANDATILGLQGKLGELKREKSVLLMTLTPNHYKVQKLETQEKELEAAIKEGSNKVLETLKSDLDRALGRESLLQKAYANASHRVSAQSGEMSEYLTLKRRVDTLRTTLESIQQKLNQTSTANSLPIGPLRLVGEADPPQIPYTPKPGLTIMMGLFGGFMFAVGIAFVREKMDSNLKAPGAVREIVNVRELGVIPAAKEDPKPWIRRKTEALLASAPMHYSFGKSPERIVAHLAWEKGSPALVESFRSTLTSLVKETGFDAKVTMVTSANSGEGKTTVASNLAVAMAQSGSRVIVVDADFRRPNIHRMFSVEPTVSLADILLSDRLIHSYAADELSVETAIPNLKVLPTRCEVDQISKILHSARFAELVDRLRHDYDVVLLDVPPIGPIADARLVGALADGAVLVVRAGQTNKNALLNACHCLIEDGIPLYGTILNDWKPTSKQSSYYSYYGTTEKLEG